MDITQIIKLATESGMGILSFVALLYFGWKAGEFAKEFMENHLTHLGGSMDKILETMVEMNEKLNRIDDNTKK